MTDRTDPADQPQGTEPDAPRTPSPESSAPSSAWPVWGATSSPRPSQGSPAAPEPDEAPAADEPDEAPAADAVESAFADASTDPVEPDDATAADASDDAPADEPDETPVDGSAEASAADASDEEANGEAATVDDGAAPDAPDEAPVVDDPHETSAADGSEHAPSSDASDDTPAADSPDETSTDGSERAADATSVADESDDTGADGSDEDSAAEASGEPGAVDTSDEAAVADEPDETPAEDSREPAATGASDAAPAADEPDEARAADEPDKAEQPPEAVPTEAIEPDGRPVGDEPVQARADGTQDVAATADPDGAVTREVAVAAPAASADAATPDEVTSDDATPDDATPDDDAPDAHAPDGDTPDEASSREEASDETRALPTVAAAARAQAVSAHQPGNARDDATAVLPPVAAPNADDGAGTAGRSGGVTAGEAANAGPKAPVRTSAMPARKPSPDQPAAQQKPAQPSPAQPSPAQPSPAQPTPQTPAGVASAAARPAAPTTRAPGAPVPPALAASSKVTAGPVPQGRRESPLDTFEEEPHVRRWPRRVLIGAVALVVLGGAYVGASYATADRVPRGTTVAGVDIGGMTEAEAVERLEQELASTLDSPIDVVAQEVQATIDPAEAGLSFDAQTTVEGLTGVDLADPSRLWRQVAGVAEREPVTTVDDAALDRAIESLETSLSQAPVDGSIVFVDGSVQATDAAEGWAVDAEGAAEAIADSWLVAAQPIELPTTTVEPAITQAETDAALNDVAEPLVDAPISVTVEGELAVLQPADVAAAASMQPEDGALVLHLDGEALAEDVVSQLPDGTLKKAADAHFGFKNDKPVLVPGRVGTTVDPEALATALETASTAQDRTAAVEVTKTDPENTSEAMKKLGVKEVVSEFSTPLTSEPRRTINIAQGLENITGVLVRPGETFSLTDALGPLDAAHGFVEAGAIVNGEHTDAWGGGLSQVSTTTFNASYFAGMEDVEHTPHSEWFSRYPEGREATIFTGVIDMKWKNTTPYGALLQGWVADGRAYVRIWSTKYWTVKSTTSGRSGVVQPTTVYSDSSTCAPQSAGNPGFSVTVTREVFLKGELEETTSRTWRYRPQNAVVCGDPPSSDDEDEADEG
jgi:vancomycin resistance protein YoaR